jgi:glycosyltransferase involved in cell wall biosynthesis
MYEISVVLPVFQNQESLTILVDRLTEVLNTMDIDRSYELIFVDDGSTDGSYETLVQLSDQINCTIKIVRLSRNFGQVAAISAGLHRATGKAVVIMSADLQDPPELIPTLHKEWSCGREIVIAHRAVRKDSFISRITSRLAYRIARTKYPSMPKGGFDFLLLSARATRVYLEMKGKNRFFQGDIMYLGYSVGLVPYVRTARETGRSQWGFWKRFKYFQDMLIASSNILPKIATLAGVFLICFGFLLATATVVLAITGLTDSSIYLPLLGLELIGVALGLVILFLGQVGEYLWRIHDELVDRPTYLVDNVVESNSNWSGGVSDDRLS